MSPFVPDTPKPGLARLRRQFALLQKAVALLESAQCDADSCWIGRNIHDTCPSLALRVPGDVLRCILSVYSTLLELLLPSTCVQLLFTPPLSTIGIALSVSLCVHAWKVCNKHKLGYPIRAVGVHSPLSRALLVVTPFTATNKMGIPSYDCLWLRLFPFCCVSYFWKYRPWILGASQLELCHETKGQVGGSSTWYPDSYDAS